MQFGKTLVNPFCEYVYFTSCVFICWMCVAFPFYFHYMSVILVFLLFVVFLCMLLCIVLLPGWRNNR